MNYPIRSRLVGVNVPPVERIASGVIGGLAIAAGLRRHSFRGLLVAGLGALAVGRAVTGRSAAYRARAVRKGIQVRRSVTVQASPREVYDLWRNLTNLPRFMKHVKSVEVAADGTSRWVVDLGPKLLAWSAEIVEDTPGHRLRWRSLPGGDIEHDGALELVEAPGDRGTIVTVKLHYLPPGGLLTASTMYGFLRSVTAAQLGTELARLQQLVETGEISTGARRVDDVEPEDTAISAIGVAPVSPAPVTTAQTSDWPTASPLDGGVR